MFFSNSLILDCVFVFFGMGIQESVPIEEVFENLRCTKVGLSGGDASKRLEIFGYNKLEEKEVRFFGSFFSSAHWLCLSH